MSRFMFQSACRGQRPARVLAPRRHGRPQRVSLLLRDRRRPRFLVAPAGFGKAMLAAEYAETVFGFRHVFWVNGASPCFLRDLDDRVMAADVREADPMAALVVFADVPLLDEERREAFAALLAELGAMGTEVIVTTTPVNDGLAAGCPDRLVLDGSALLLDEDEAPAVAGLPAAERVACLQWADEGPRCLAEGCAREELPADARMALWALLTMGRGRRADLRALLGADRADEMWAHLGRRYPFLGIDGDEDAFVAAPVDSALLARAFAGSMGAMAAAAGCDRRDGLVGLVADRLVAAGEGARAARLVEALATRTAAGAWLGRRGWDLVREGAAAELCRLYEAASHGKLEARSAVNAMVACAHGQLGHRSAAVDFARKVTSATLAPGDVKAVAALCAYRQGNATVRSRMGEVLAAWLAEPPRAADGTSGTRAEVTALLAAVALAEGGAEDPVGLWVRRSAPLRARALEAADVAGCLVAAAWAVDGSAAAGAFERRSSEAPAAHPGLFELAEWACAALDGAQEGEGALGYGAELAAEALERIGDALEAAGARRPSAAALQAARASRARRCPTRPAPGPGAAAVWGAGVPTLAAARSFPVLEVRLFGTMRATLGSRELTVPLLGSRRVRTLLALLVLHRGREISRDDLVAMLWPHADLRTGRKSFYRLWQTLRDLLSVDGACPYLVRDRAGCRLDAALFTSDVMEFEDVVRALLFGGAALAAGWERLHEQVRTAFSGDLMPGEADNEVIAGFRERFSLELTDGLVAASRRLREAGEPQGALWFARAALERDGAREDAYTALMEAQLVAGQRSGAVATYHTCRRRLADSLGLDPSRRLGDLYQRAIEEGPVPVG